MTLTKDALVKFEEIEPVCHPAPFMHRHASTMHLSGAGITGCYPHHGRPANMHTSDVQLILKMYVIFSQELSITFSQI